MRAHNYHDTNSLYGLNSFIDLFSVSFFYIYIGNDSNVFIFHINGKIIVLKNDFLIFNNKEIVTWIRTIYLFLLFLVMRFMCIILNILKYKKISYKKKIWEFYAWNCWLHLWNEKCESTKFKCPKLYSILRSHFFSKTARCHICSKDNNYFRSLFDLMLNRK